MIPIRMKMIINKTKLLLGGESELFEEGELFEEDKEGEGKLFVVVWTDEQIWSSGMMELKFFTDEKFLPGGRL